MKKTIALLCAVAMLAPLCCVPARAAGLSSFQKTQTYAAGQYADVPAGSTFAANVQTAYEYGIMQGYGETFGVTGNITRLASVIIACRLHRIYSVGVNDVETLYAGTTQEIYLAYAKDNGIYCSFPDTSVAATRAEFAQILSSALPDEALATVNEVWDNAIPDVGVNDTFAPAIYRLYRAGILNGSDAKGTFYPTTAITRGAACAIATRMADPSLRKAITLTQGYTHNIKGATQIYAACSPAVAYVEVGDADGNATASGSGFFIDPSGVFVTCYHVIEGSQIAAIQTQDGKVYGVKGVYDYSKEHDWAVLQIDGTGFPSLTVGGTDEYATGSAVYAIGSPEGYSDTISEGIVANAARTVGGTTYIQ
ncbi:MAG: trypsin-like peptidase domain-containing protein, partial [Oscillibacter sp.]|nr:trypsin-like peptidase domain-containing protein [Oscillibacter sp.]